MTETYSISNSEHFNGTTPLLSQLEQEIAASSIVTAVNYSGIDGDNVHIYFASAISPPDSTTLSGLVSAHSPNTTTFSNSITIIPKQEEHNNTTYVRLGVFTYQGSDTMGPILKVCGVSYKDVSPTNYSLRLYDKTNATVIAEATFTNTTESVVHFGAISNVPTGEAILEVQGKRTGGTGNQKSFYVSAVNIYL